MTLPIGSRGKLSKWGKLLGKRAGSREAGTTVLNSNVPDSLSPTLELEHPEEQRCRPRPGRALAPAPHHHTGGNERIQEGVGNKGADYISDVGFEDSL